MITCCPQPWQAELRNALRDPKELVTQLELPAGILDGGPDPDFPLRVPRGYVSKIRPRDLHDPLLRQILPLPAESDRRYGYCRDPLHETRDMPTPGLIHKYHGRVLLIATGACAMHCRYCFRQYFSYGDANAARDNWRGVVAYIRGRESLSEVILSGGDPLSLGDQKLARLSDKLRVIPHVRRLRIHTRLPIVLPERVVDSLIEWIDRSPLQVVVVVHANHSREIDHCVSDALQRLRTVCNSVLNQSVLLRGVNDCPDALCALSEALLDAGVLPYYLHSLDPVQGADRFHVDTRSARRIMRELRRRLPGYLVPRLVKEVAGMPFKIPL